MEFRSKPWYNPKPVLTDDESRAYFQGKLPGDFLVRKSSHHETAYVLVVLKDVHPQLTWLQVRFQITLLQNVLSVRMVGVGGSQATFSSVEAMLEKWSQERLGANYPLLRIPANAQGFNAPGMVQPAGPRSSSSSGPATTATLLAASKSMQRSDSVTPGTPGTASSVPTVTSPLEERRSSTINTRVVPNSHALAGDSKTMSSVSAPSRESAESLPPPPPPSRGPSQHASDHSPNTLPVATKSLSSPVAGTTTGTASTMSAQQSVSAQSRAAPATMTAEASWPAPPKPPIRHSAFETTSSPQDSQVLQSQPARSQSQSVSNARQSLPGGMPEPLAPSTVVNPLFHDDSFDEQDNGSQPLVQAGFAHPRVGRSLSISSNVSASSASSHRRLFRSQSSASSPGALFSPPFSNVQPLPKDVTGSIPGNYGNVSKPSFLAKAFPGSFGNIERILNACARRGKTDKMKKILELHPSMNVNYVDIANRERNALWRKRSPHWAKLCSPLAWCALNGNGDGLNALLQRSADPFQFNSSFDTPLHLAVGSSIGAALIETMGRVGQQLFGADSVNQRINLVNCEGLAPIHSAAKLGKSDVIRVLVQFGSDVDLQSSIESKSPLHFAACAGHAEAVAELLSLNADPQSQCAPDHEAPIHSALVAMKGNKDPRQCLRLLQAVVNLTEAAQIDVNLSRKDGATALLLALECIADEQSVNALVGVLLNKNSADPNAATSGSRHHSLFYALKFQPRNLFVTDILLKAGGKPGHLDKSHENVIHEAVRVNSVDHLDLYLKASVSDINTKTSDGLSPLLLSVVLPETAPAIALRILKVPEVNVDALDANGNSSLHHSAKSATLEVLEALLLRHANCDFVNSSGQTPLSLACEEIQRSTSKSAVAVASALIPHTKKLDFQNHLGNSVLLCALSSSSTALMLLQAGANPNAVNKKGESPLHVAIELNLVEAVEILCNAAGVAHADINNQLPPSGMTPIIHACQKKSLRSVQSIIKAGGGSQKLDLECKVNGNTALHFAMLNLVKGQSEEVESIAVSLINVSRPELVNSADASGKFPVWRALEANNFPALDALMRNGASVLFKETESGLTPLLFAVKRQLDERIITMLISVSGDVVEAVDDLGWTVLLHLVNKQNHNLLSALLNGPTLPNLDIVFPESNESACFACVRADDSTALQMLIEKGASLDTCSHAGLSPLLYAVHNDKSAAMMNTLVRYTTTGVDIVGPDKRTAIQVAAKKMKWDVVAEIARAEPCPNLNLQDPETLDSLAHVVLQYDQGELLRLLVQRGCSLDLSALGGETPLHYALRTGKSDATAAFLVEKTAKIEAKNESGETALLLACKLRRLATLVACLNVGASLDVVDSLGRSPVVIVVENDDAGMLEVLLNNGASVDIPTKSGLTSLLAAITQNKSPSVIKLIITNTKTNLEMKQDGLTAVQWLCERGDAQNVKSLLLKGASPDNRDQHNRALLHVAIQSGEIDMLEAVLPHASADELGWPSKVSPLHYIVVSDSAVSASTQIDLAATHPLDLSVREKMLQILAPKIKETIDLTFGNSGSPLCVAVAQNNVAFVQEMITKANPRPNVNFMDPKTGKTPLFLAIEQDSDPLVTFLLSQSADADLQSDILQVSPLAHAIKLGKESIALAILNHATNIEAVDLKLRATPLFHACKAKQLSVVRRLLDRKANPNAKTVDGQTPLSLCVAENLEEFSQLLLENGVSVDVCDASGLTPLLRALQRKDVPLATKLLTSGMKDGAKMSTLDQSDSNGNTALLLAVEQGSVFLVKQLISAGANIKVGTASGHSRSPLHVALQGAHQEITKFLIKTISHDGTGDLEFLLFGDKAGQSSFHISCERGLCSVLHLLIEECKRAGNDKSLLARACNATDLKNNTPLGLAARSNSWMCVKLLLRTPVALDVDCIVGPSRSGDTVLHWAILNQNIEMTKVFVRRTQKINAQDEEGATPLIVAASNPVTGTAAALVSILLSGVDHVSGGSDSGQRILMNAKDKKGFTALHWAIMRSNVEVVRLLLSHGADVNVCDYSKTTPLILAVKKSTVGEVPTPLFTELLKADVNLDAQDDADSTALLYACSSLNIDLVKLLLTSGAKPDIAISGLTPLAVMLFQTGGGKAIVQKRDAIMKELMNHGANADFFIEPASKSLFDCVQVLDKEINVVDEGYDLNRKEFAYVINYKLRSGENTSTLGQIRTGMVANMLRQQLDGRIQARAEQNVKYRQSLPAKGSLVKSHHQMEYDFFVSFQWSSEGGMSQSPPSSYYSDEPQNDDNHLLSRTTHANGFAKMLVTALRTFTDDKGKPMRVWFDEEQMSAGVNLVEKFISGVKNSAVFVPLVSYSLLERFALLKEGGDCNPLREWDCAIDLFKTPPATDERSTIRLMPVLLAQAFENGTSRKFEYRLDKQGNPCDVIGTMPEVYPVHQHGRTVRGSVKFMLQSILALHGDPSKHRNEYEVARELVHAFKITDFYDQSHNSDIPSDPLDDVVAKPPPMPARHFSPDQAEEILKGSCSYHGKNVESAQTRAKIDVGKAEKALKSKEKEIREEYAEKTRKRHEEEERKRREEEERKRREEEERKRREDERRDALHREQLAKAREEAVLTLARAMMSDSDSD